MLNRKTLDFKNLIRNPKVWPGGYPRYAVMSDGAALCVDCCADSVKLVLRSTRDDDNRSGWCFEGSEINWEDSSLYCAHCDDRIEPAYGV